MIPIINDCVKFITVIVLLAGFFALWDICTNWGYAREHWTSKEDIWHGTVIYRSNYWGKLWSICVLKQVCMVNSNYLAELCICNAHCCWCSIICFLNACLQVWVSAVNVSHIMISYKLKPAWPLRNFVLFCELMSFWMQHVFLSLNDTLLVIL